MQHKGAGTHALERQAGAQRQHEGVGPEALSDTYRRSPGLGANSHSHCHRGSEMSRLCCNRRRGSHTASRWHIHLCLQERGGPRVSAEPTFPMPHPSHSQSLSQGQAISGAKALNTSCCMITGPDLPSLSPQFAKRKGNNAA